MMISIFFRNEGNIVRELLKIIFKNYLIIVLLDIKLLKIYNFLLFVDAILLIGFE